MLNKINEFIQKNRLLDGCGHIVLGLSGGADSVCLLYVLTELRKEYGYGITAIHVHHGIRGPEADRDVDFCSQICKKLDVELVIRYVDIPAIADKTGESMEEAGRRIRYEIFNEEASKKNNCKIAVAHHANDRAETILFNMVRGTGIKGLHGIKAKRDNVIRPLLGCSRKDIEDYLSAHNVDFCNDSTNFSNLYTRNKIRNIILPCMEEINSAAIKNISALADKIEELENFVDEVTDLKYKQCVSREFDGIMLKGIEGESPFVVKNLIIRAVGELACGLKDITDAHINSIYALCNKNAGFCADIKYGLMARRDVDGIFICHKNTGHTIQIDVEVPSEVALDDNNYIKFTKILWNNKEKFSNQVYTKHFDYDKIKFNLQIRTRRDEDYLVVDKEGHKKALNRYFIDEKIPGRMRDELLLLADGSHIIWVIGYRISEAYKVTKDTVNVLCVEYGGTEHV